MLTDSYGRIATDLRVSLTDRCNLRCSYCMPPEGLDWLPKPEVLTGDEVARLVRIGVETLGIREVRFTGGEPLLRRDLVAIIAATAALSPRPEISLTTNGIGLDRLAAALRDAGLDRINVSLDTLRPEVFRKLTHRDRLPDVLSGLAAAASAGLTPVKVNAVLMRDLNDDEAPELLRYCVEHGYELRFIEQMPLDAQHGWKRAEMITASEIFDSLSREFKLSEDSERVRGAAPAETFLVDGGPARVGVIAFRHPPVLRRVRPGAAHRRRADPQLPVRPVGERPARPAAVGGARTRKSPTGGGRRSRRSCQGTGSTTRPSSSRTARCPRSAATPAPARALPRPAAEPGPGPGLPAWWIVRRTRAQPTIHYDGEPSAGTGSDGQRFALLAVIQPRSLADARKLVRCGRGGGRLGGARSPGCGPGTRAAGWPPAGRCAAPGGPVRW